jgi:hypothetical protein
MVDFSRLSSSWIEWAPGAGLADAWVSMTCNDCQILFISNDYSVHLRKDGNWWMIDTVDDRGQRSNGVAKLATFDLAEKYLVWDWLTSACSSLASGQLGADLYRKGYAPGVEVSPVDDAHIKICLHGDCAILIVGTATVFSHIMLKSVDEVEQIARAHTA